MLRILQGTSVLLLLSIFLAYVLAPMVEGVRRRVHVLPRRRPLPRGIVLAAFYLVVFAGGVLAWNSSAANIRNAVNVSAPAALDRLFGGTDVGPGEELLSKIPGPPAFRQTVMAGARRVVSYIEREVRTTFGELLAAAPYAASLLVVPLIAAFLITNAPGFRRSAERFLPHGHLQWRGGEYMSDVNSALAGYVRAQLAAGVIVGAICVVGFVLLRLPYAVSMGITAGVLELLPAIGPVVVLLMATSQAEGGALAVAAFLAALRVVQDYVVYPRLVRHGMRLSTPVVVLSIWCGAALGGAVGVILAIPVAGFLSVSLRHWREYRLIERVVREGEAERQARGL